MEYLVEYTIKVANLITVPWPCANIGPITDGWRVGDTLPDGTLLTESLIGGFRDEEELGLVASNFVEMIRERGLNRFAAPHGTPIMPGGEIHTVLVESPCGVIVRGIMSPDVLGHEVYRFDILGGVKASLDKARLIPPKVG